MKINQIVKVDMNITTADATINANANLNHTAGVVVIRNEVETEEIKTDLSWLPVSELLTATAIFPDRDETTKVSPTQEALRRLANVYSNNGGVNLVVKRIYVGGSGVVAAKVTNAIKGKEGHKAIGRDVINIMVVDEADVLISSLATIADSLAKDKYEEKILLLNRNEVLVTANLANKSNVVINYYKTNANTEEAATENNYEVALIAAYVSKINYNSDLIQGLEYTPFVGDLTKLNVANDVPALEDTGLTYVNIITHLVDRYLLIGGVTASGTDYLAKYFQIVLGQKITEELTRLTINKLRFENATYSAIQNRLTILLDIFSKNRLLDMEYIAEKDVRVVRSEMSGDTTYTTVRAGEVFTQGYKVFTLPPSKEDLNSKTYSGVFVYIALAGQISIINVTGLLVGGV